MYAKIEDQIKNAVDVSGSYDNCFFHSYALYLLTNDIPLPKKLFNFNSIMGKESKAAKLAFFFPNQRSLNQIALLDSSKNASTNYLFEKTLVLGILFREWFPTRLINHPNVAHELLKGQYGVLTGFENYKNFREFMSKEELSTSEFSVLYDANQEFLEYYYHRSQGKIDRNSPFEAYFAEASSDKEAISNYWNSKGYVSYCTYMAQPQVKLSPIEIIAMMKLADQPLTIYDRSTVQVIVEYRKEGSKRPKFAVALHATEGHYFLVKSDETAKELSKYEQSYQQYIKDRDIVLSRVDQPISSLFVRAICPKGHLDEEPFDALLEYLSALEQFKEKESAPQENNSHFLLDIDVAALGFSAALVTLLSVYILDKQFKHNPHLEEKMMATAVGLGMAGVGYSLYSFFSSNDKSSTQSESECHSLTKHSNNPSL